MISRVIRHKVEFKDLARLWGARMRRAAEWVRIMLQCLRERRYVPHYRRQMIDETCVPLSIITYKIGERNL